MPKKVFYGVCDGDFGDHNEVSEFASDLLEDRYGDALEIALSLVGPEKGQTPAKIRVEVTWDEESEGWEVDYYLDLPEKWSYEQVSSFLFDGYTVYLQPEPV